MLRIASVARRHHGRCAMTTLRPSQVRARILREHATLRERVEALADLIAQLRAGSTAVLARGLADAQALCCELREHIDFEDALLEPALRETDAWGSVRAERLVRHHAAQRKHFAELEEL